MLVYYSLLQPIVDGRRENFEAVTSPYTELEFAQVYGKRNVNSSQMSHEQPPVILTGHESPPASRLHDCADHYYY